MSSYLNVNSATQAQTTPGVGERTRTNPDAGELVRTPAHACGDYSTLIAPPTPELPMAIQSFGRKGKPHPAKTPTTKATE
jgi:hypothetical protein